MGTGELQHGVVPGLLKEWLVGERRVYESCPQSVMVIFLLVLPSLEPQRSMASTTFIPSLTRPKTTCLPSNLPEKHQSQLVPNVPQQKRPLPDGDPQASPPIAHSSPLSLGGADEELGAIRVGARIGHGQDTRACVLQDEVLIWEFLPIDGFSSSAIVACEVTTL